jgi:hypothetical protein
LFVLMCHGFYCRVALRTHSSTTVVKWELQRPRVIINVVTRLFENDVDGLVPADIAQL